MMDFFALLCVEDKYLRTCHVCICREREKRGSKRGHFKEFHCHLDKNIKFMLEGGKNAKKENF